MADRIRINARSLPWLIEIDRYVREFDIHGRSTLRSAASDVLDSHAMRDELDDLIRRRLLTVERFQRDGYPCDIPGMCGRDGWTVALTDRAMRALWPGRMVEPPRWQRKRRHEIEAV